MRIGVDLGGTKIEAVVLDGTQVVARQRIATPQNQYQETLDALLALIAQLHQQVGAQALPVGLGHPGSIDPVSGLLRNANSTCLNGRPLKQDLERRLGRTIASSNDANCLALSEAYDGAAAGAESAFCVILGTGVGGAMLIGGQLWQGANALAGEWGHNPMPGVRETRDCWCGHSDCIESWLSGPALQTSFTQASGQHADVPRIVALAQAGDQIARQVLDQYAQGLARALAGVVNLFDPHRIILAGGLSRIQSLYDLVPEYWNRWVFARQVRTELLPARHGDASGVLGAARLSQ